MSDLARRPRHANRPKVIPQCTDLVSEESVQFGNTLILNLDGPLGGVPAPGTIQSGYLKGFKDLLSSRGADPRRFLERHDIDPVAFENCDHNVDCTAAVNLLEYCSRVLDEPLFGLRLAEQQDPEVFGLAMARARAAPNLREALQSLVDYVPVSTSLEGEVEVAVARDVVEVRWRTSTGLGDCEQVNYQGLLLFVKTLQMLARQHFRPRYASLTFKIPRADIQPLQDRLGCKVHGRGEAHAVAFSADLLDLPIATSNRMLFSLLGGYLSQLRTASRSGFVEQVESYVRGALSSGNCTVEGCAKKLGTSARTLQKRLMVMNVKFSDIVQAERIKFAKDALIWSDRKLDEIAFHLGYSEQTSFGRAFKRSTGYTPQAFRAAEQQRQNLSLAAALDEPKARN